MSVNNESYCIFSDESGQDGTNRFGAISMISGDIVACRELHKELEIVSKENNVNDFKFKKVNGRDSLKVGKQFIDLLFKYVIKHNVALHVLIWDKRDSRHDLPGIDELENLKILYYRNLVSIKRFWSKDTIWEFYPDEYQSIDWSEITNLVESKNLKIGGITVNELFGLKLNIHNASYGKTKEVNSEQFYIVQLADLLGGLTRLTYEKSKEYQSFGNKHISQRLFDEDTTKISKKQQSKFSLVDYFRSKSKLHKLGVNFSKNKRLETFKKGQLNIWFYQPQHELDKAPLKKQRK